jgi:hypothetical protein
MVCTGGGVVVAPQLHTWACCVCDGLAVEVVGEAPTSPRCGSASHARQVVVGGGEGGVDVVWSIGLVAWVSMALATQFVLTKEVGCMSTILARDCLPTPTILAKDSVHCEPSRDAKVIQGGVMYWVAPFEGPSPMAPSGGLGALWNIGAHGLAVVQVGSGQVIAWYVLWLHPSCTLGHVVCVMGLWLKWRGSNLPWTWLGGRPRMHNKLWLGRRGGEG